MALRKTVDLYYDVASPYAWIAFEQLFSYSDSWNIDVRLKPFSLAGVFIAANRGNPGSTPAKFKYMCSDAERSGQYYGIPIHTPNKAHDRLYAKGTLHAMRLITVINQARPELTPDISRQLWSRIWSKDQDITERQSLVQAGMDIGLSQNDMDHYLSKIKEKCTTIGLRAVTDEALQIGAFGAPTIVVQGEDKKRHMLFGSDRMHILATLLGKSYQGQMINRDLSKRLESSTTHDTHKEMKAVS